MPLYRPSVFAAVASAIFFVLALITFNDKEWVDVLMWALLGIAFAISLAPRRTFGSHTSIVAGGMLAIGTILFVLDAAEKLT